MFTFTIDSNYPLSKQEAKMCTPEGWHRIIDELFETAAFLGIEIFEIRYVKGTLRVEKHSVVEELQNKIFNKVINLLSRESAMTCLACGKSGRRRKGEPEWPPMCSHHYVEYVNSLPETDKTTEVKNV